MPATQIAEKTLTQVQSKADLYRELDASGPWSVSQIEALFALPFSELMFRAQEVHRLSFPDGDVELATLLSIKTGGALRIAATAHKLPATTQMLRPIN